MHKHIYNYFLAKHVLSPYQLGFESGDSTIDQLVYLNNKFLQALDEGKEIRTNINEVSYHKYLGIVLSSGATWTNHLDIARNVYLD